jgi:hypothetical protein
MNLELLSPRQIPDRVDSTLQLPHDNEYHQARLLMMSAAAAKASASTSPNAAGGGGSKDMTDLKSAHYVSFNRRGSYLAVGYGSGILAVYDVLSRTLSGLYQPGGGVAVAGIENLSPSPTQAEATTTTTTKITTNDVEEINGVSSISWSRRSRTMLTGSLGSKAVWLVDATHPYGPECAIPSTDPKDKDKDGDEDNNHNNHNNINSSNHRSTSPTNSETMKNSASGGTAGNSGSQSSSLINGRKKDFVRKPGKLQVTVLPSSIVGGDGGDGASSVTTGGYRRERQTLPPVSSSASSQTNTNNAGNRFPWVQFDLPLAVGSSMQIHPRDNCSGVAVLEDGSIIAFRVPVDAFVVPLDGVDESLSSPAATSTAVVRCATIFRSDKYFITCSVWDPTKKNNNNNSDRLYATTSEGKMLGFDVTSIFDALALAETTTKPSPPVVTMVEPNFVISIPGGATTWQVVVNRNGSHLVINSSDAALRLYDTKECWMTPEEVEKPKFAFQDVVSRVKFSSCDLSSDGEYLVGCANSGDNTRYELYIWNTQTGVLMDKLTGAAVEAYSVAWHPTRSFIAVATSDGLVDIWGPKMSWYVATRRREEVAVVVDLLLVSIVILSQGTHTTMRLCVLFHGDAVLLSFLVCVFY